MVMFGKVSRAQRVQEPKVPIVDRGEVARVAYELYLQRGRLDGRDVDDWLKAETILRQRKNGRSTPRG